MTVSIAVTNSASTCRPANVPRMAKVPTTTITSCSRAISAVSAHAEVGEAERHPGQDADRAEDDQQDRLLAQLGADQRTDRRLLEDLVDRAELGFQRGAQLTQLAGRRQDRAWRGRAAMVSHPRQRRLTRTVRAKRPVMATGWARPRPRPTEPASRKGSGRAKPLVPAARRGRAASVRIRTYCLSPVVTSAASPWRPCSSRTARMSAGVGCWSRAKWTSRTVPPVKSIENLRPSWPPVRKVRRMK